MVDLLEGARFEREGRVWFRTDLGLTVDVVASDLRRGQQAVDLELEGDRFPVLSFEDLLVDRLCAAKFWTSQTDREQAMLLWGTVRDEMDHDRLRGRARQEGVEDVLDEVVEVVGPVDLSDAPSFRDPDPKAAERHDAYLYGGPGSSEEE